MNDPRAVAVDNERPQPPMPQVVVKGQEVPVLLGNYKWQENGQGVIAESVHPLEMIKPDRYQPVSVSPGALADIQFDEAPGEIPLRIKLWKEEGEIVQTLTPEGQLKLPEAPGLHVYELYGKWKKGDGHFVFAVEVTGI